jgi:predicted transcriptional regulator
LSDETDVQPVELATELTIAWLGNPNNRVAAEEADKFLRTIYATLIELGKDSPLADAETDAAQDYAPAVTVRRSLASKDHILSLIDGKPYKLLTRHLTTHGLTPAEYRRRYNLRPDYPMVAENYATHRRELAKRIGLGRKPAVALPVAADPAPRTGIANTPVTPKTATKAVTPRKAAPKARAKIAAATETASE